MPNYKGNGTLLLAALPAITKARNYDIILSFLIASQFLTHLTTVYIVESEAFSQIRPGKEL